MKKNCASSWLFIEIILSCELHVFCKLFQLLAVFLNVRDLYKNMQVKL